MMQDRERSRAKEPAVKPHAVAVLAGDDAETVVLDFVQPRLAGWRLWSFHRETRRDKAGREGTRLVNTPDE